jgi:hypothetical protein
MEGMKLLPAIVVTLCAAGLAAQTAPPSSAPARDLSKLLSDRKIDSVATRLPGSDDEFAAVLAFPGQLVVIWAKFSAPQLLNEKLIRKEYRDVYLDLNSASIVESRHFVTDLGADGMIARPARNQPADMHDLGKASMRFDGNWREDKMSEDEYMKRYSEAEAGYTKALQALLEELKKAA